MENLATLIKILGSTSSGLSGLGVAAVIFFLWKEGIISFSKKDGNVGSLYQQQINALEKHATIANEEMGEIRDDFKEIKEDFKEVKNNVSDLKSDVSYIKGKLDT